MKIFRIGDNFSLVLALIFLLSIFAERPTLHLNPHINEKSQIDSNLMANVKSNNSKTTRIHKKNSFISKLMDRNT
jgi:hypothetical protein